MTRPVHLRDPMALSRGGEIAFLILTSALLLVALTAALGIAVSGAAFGHGWVWPHGSQQWVHLMIATGRGHPAEAFTARSAGRLPARTTVYGCVAVAEVCLAIAATTCCIWISQWWRGPTDPRRGMASRAHAREALGVRELRRHRRVIRPDLHRKAGT